MCARYIYSDSMAQRTGHRSLCIKNCQSIVASTSPKTLFHRQTRQHIWRSYILEVTVGLDQNIAWNLRGKLFPWKFYVGKIFFLNSIETPWNTTWNTAWITGKSMGLLHVSVTFRDIEIQLFKESDDRTVLHPSSSTNVLNINSIVPW